MSEAARRWRLMLGPESENRLGGLSGEDAGRDSFLERLYGAQGVSASAQDRRLFPPQAQSFMIRTARERRAAGLLADPELLDSLPPTAASLRLLLRLQGEKIPPDREARLRATIRRIVDEIVARLRPPISRAFLGRRDRSSGSALPRAADFDARATIRRNLRHWDAANRRLIPAEPRFFRRGERRLPWRVVICVDQSGSMTESLIHAAVTAAILAGLPGLRTHLLLFDTRILDVSEDLADPLKVLSRAGLGGGTDIAGALERAESLLTDPERSAVVLISDFCEGGPVERLERVVARLAGSRARLLGLAALDAQGAAFHDRDMAARLADLGMRTGVLPPESLAAWIAEALR